MIKLVVYGLTGSGKSTSSGLIRDHFESKGYQVANLKLAQPLYELQQQFYRAAGKQISLYDQDQILLECIATQLRRVSPTSLVDSFLRRLEITKADIVINDDLRDVDVDYPMLKQHGFSFIRITCREEIRLERLKQRSDLSIVTNSTTTTKLDMIQPHAIIDNSGSLVDLKQNICTALKRLT